MNDMEKKEQELDLFVLLEDILREAGRLWRMGLMLILVCSLGLAGYSRLEYQSIYEASASFTVRTADLQQSSYDSRTGEQLAKAFVQILSSDVLCSRVEEELDLARKPDIRTAAEATSGIITLTVSDQEPECAWEILCSALYNAVGVAEYVTGPTYLVMLEESGVPEMPAVPFRFGNHAKNGAILGALLWVLVSALAALSRDTIHSAEELHPLLGRDCLCSIPAVKTAVKGELPLIHRRRKEPRFRESVRLLRLRVEKLMQQQNKKVLLVSSATHGEGNTVVALNLAISLAGKGKRVLLIDWNPEPPSATAALHRDPAAGLCAYLTGQAGIREILHPTEIENLFLLPGGPADREGLNRERIEKLIGTVRKLFDYVILDAPACSDSLEAAAGLAECALMVVCQDYASRDRILDGIQQLEDWSLPLLGCVMNRMQRRIFSGCGNGYVQKTE